MGYLIVTGEENYVLGTIIFQKVCTLANIHHEVVDDELIEYPFNFISELGHTLNIKQEQKRKATTLIGINTMDFDTLETNIVESTPNPQHNRESVEEGMHE